MPIEACLVARGSVILAEFSPPSTNFSVIASKLVQQIPASPDSKKSYSYDTYNFHYLVERGITYLCMTDQQMGYRVPYAFLFDLASRFRGTYAERIQTAGAMAMNDSFSRVIKERMDFFSNDKQADKINKVKADLDETKNVMFQNIDKVLQRGEQIETLVDKTDELNLHATSFKKKIHSTQTKNVVEKYQIVLYSCMHCCVASWRRYRHCLLEIGGFRYVDEERFIGKYHGGHNRRR